MGESVSEELIDAARGYENLFVPALFQPWTSVVLDAAAVARGMRVLDVACGTGVLGRSALQRCQPEGSVAGVDPAPGMLAVARQLEPGIEWVLGQAESLPFDDEDFDAVVSQFGLMFFHDPVGAVREMHRVLRPGRSAVVAVWDDVSHNPAYADLIEVLEEQVGSAAADALRLPFRLGDRDGVVSWFESAGFTRVDAVTLTRQARFPASRQMVEAELRGWLPLFDIHLDEEEIAEVLRRSDARLAAYVDESGSAAFATSAHVITALKT